MIQNRNEYKKIKNDKTENDKNENWSSITKAFPFLEERGHVVSIAGAGGKTTLMYFLAKHCVMRGIRVLVSTTTHIRKPTDNKSKETDGNVCLGKGGGVLSFESEAVWIKEATELDRFWEMKKIPVMGIEEPDGKLTMPKRDRLAEAIRKADLVFLEADGARQMPCKAPNNTEPVFLDESDIVIAVLGVDAVGKTLSEACFRAELAVERLHGGMDHQLETSDLATLLLAEWGTRKGVGGRDYYIVLNKCYSDIDSAKELRNILRQSGTRSVVMTDFTDRGEKMQCIL